jgi:hypothetical protein
MSVFSFTPSILTLITEKAGMVFAVNAIETSARSVFLLVPKNPHLCLAI